MNDRDAPVVLVEDHGYPLISVEPVESLHSRARRGLLYAVLGFTVGLVVGVSVVRAAPRSAPQSATTIPVVALVVEGRTGAPQDGNSGRWLQGGQRSVETGGAPLSGIASWYPARGLIAAAGPGLRHGNWRGSHLVVSARGRSVTVDLSDWCACPHGRLIDLSDDAFARLAPLSRGLVRVSVTAVGPAPALPETDRETP